MIEALACGTPVIAWRNGAVPEIIQDGVTGFVVDTIASAVDAVPKVARLDRFACRQTFEQRFDTGRMARNYVEVYERLIRNSPERRPLHDEAVAARK
jgi:glycosyltransferase involved in cell wall biosynthesis